MYCYLNHWICVLKYHKEHHPEWVLHTQRHLCLHQPVSSQSRRVSLLAQLSKKQFFLYVPFFPVIILHGFFISSDLWGDPGTFRPERFLGPSGLLNKELTEKVLIFGMGKRRCLGDRLARLEMFIFLTTLLHGRWIENVPEQELDLSTDFGLTMKPHPYRITISSRF